MTVATQVDTEPGLPVGFTFSRLTAFARGCLPNLSQLAHAASNICVVRVSGQLRWAMA